MSAATLPAASPDAAARPYKMATRAIFFTAIILAQLFLYGTFLKRADIRTSDFPVYYAVARLWQGDKNPYDLNNQCQAVQPLTASGDCSPLAHPPVMLPLIALVSSENFVASFWRWVIILIAVSALSFVILWRLSESWHGAAQALLFYPLPLSIFFGNDTAFVLCAVLLFAWLMLCKKKDFLAGIALSLTVLKPQLAIILAVPLLFAKPKAFLGFCVGGAALTLYSFWLVGVDGFKGILDITSVMSKGVGYGVNQTSMVNTTGILTRSGLSPFWAWPIYALSIGFLCMRWKTRGADVATISITLILALFTAPHVHTYDLALLAIPLVFAHRLAPLVASLIVIVSVPFHAPHIAALLIFVSLAVLYLHDSKSVSKNKAPTARCTAV